MIRYATAEDADSIYDIYFHPEINPYFYNGKIGRDKFRRTFAGWLKFSKVLVYEEDNKIIGFITFQMHGGRLKHLARVCPFAVLPEHRKKGIGAELMARAISEMKKHKIVRAAVYIDTENTETMEFYKRFGFELEGTARKYYLRNGKLRDCHLLSLLLED